MTFRKSVFIGAVGVLSAFSGIAVAGEVNVPAQCILGNHKVQSVKPYKTERQTGKVKYAHLAGADAQIAAEHGLSTEWLRTDLGRRMNECGLDRKDVNVIVSPRASGYSVKFASKDLGDAKSVFEQVKKVVE